MKELKYFSLKEWFCLTPLVALYKERRNDFTQSLYVKKIAEHEQVFLQQCLKYKDQDVAIIVAFEQPWALNWLLKMAKSNLKATQILVFDNSHNPQKRIELQRICQENQTPYLALPYNLTRHVNRSHGMAMTWIYQRIIKKIQPKSFSFLDHDLIPVKPIALGNKLRESQQPFWGMLNKATHMPYWQLWAGYCVFDYLAFKDKPLNFLYDFSRGLDTGGRNWPFIYQHANLEHTHFANNEQRSIQLPSGEKNPSAQVIDDAWFHIGSISYNNHFQQKEAFVKALANYLEQGYAWDDCITSP